MNRRAHLLAVLTFALFALGTAHQAHAQQTADTFKLPLEDRRMTPVYRAVGTFFNQAAAKAAEVGQQAENAFTYAKGKVIAAASANPAPPVPVVTTYQPPLPVLCPSPYWRDLEAFSYWLSHSPAQQAQAYTAIDAAKQACGTNPAVFKDNLNTVEDLSYKFFPDNEAAPRALNASGKLADLYGALPRPTATN